MKQLTPTIALILLSILFFYSCNESKKKDKPTEVVVEEMSESEKIDALNLQKAADLMNKEDISLADAAAASYYYSLVPEEAILSEEIHRSNIDELLNQFQIKNLKQRLLIQTIDTEVEVDQFTAGFSQRINDTFYYFQPYLMDDKGIYQNIIYDGDFSISNIQKIDTLYYNATNLVYTNNANNYYFYYVSNVHPFTNFELIDKEDNYEVDTTIYYIEGSDTLVLDRFADNNQQLYFFHPRATVHYHAPCKTKPNTSVPNTRANNRMIKIVENGHSLNGKNYRMVITPPDCARVSETKLETETFKVKLARIYYKKFGGKQISLDTIAYFPEAL